MLKVLLFVSQDKDDALFVADLGDIVHKYKTWKAQLPHVAPFYGKSSLFKVVIALWFLTKLKKHLAP